MNVSIQKRILSLGGGLALLLAATPSSPDEVTLQTGGVLRGKVTRSTSTVAVTTPQGTRIVVERASVRKIGREAVAAAPSKTPLSDAEKSWVAQVRKLVRRAKSEDRETGARAMRDLRAINDPAALPALMQSLRTSDLDSLRLLYVRILGDMPGSKAIVSLVEEALFDTSPAVRDAAQEASKKQRPAYVRPYYGQALRFPNRDVVCRAASVLSTVGDRDNVPGLIDSLYSTTVDVVLRPSCCMSRVTYLANPRGSSYIQDNVIAQGNGTSVAYHDRLVARTVVRQVENPEVKEALEAITKQSFGYDAAAWRRWWKTQQLADSSGR